MKEIHRYASQIEDAQKNVEAIRSLGEVGGTLLDLGANIGEVSIQCAKQFDWVVAIESHPDTFAVLETRIRESKIRNIEPRNYAVAPIGGTCYWASTPGVCAVDSNARPFKQFEGLKDYYRPVTTCCFDTVLKNEEPRVIKMDIEGGEFGCLESATIPKSVQHIFVEFHGHRQMVRIIVERMKVFGLVDEGAEEKLSVSPNFHLISMMFGRKKR